MIRRLLIAVAALGGAGAWAGWKLLVKRTGDPLFVWTDIELSNVTRTGSTLSGTIGIANRGSALGVVRRVDGRVVSGGAGRVLATLQGSDAPERGWWYSNFLQPGESCVAEVDVELDGETDAPVEIELTIQELGRRLFQYRTIRLTVDPAPAAQR